MRGERGIDVGATFAAVNFPYLFFFVFFVLVTCVTGADPASHRVRLWRGGSASSLFFYLFFCSFVEYVDIDALTYLKARMDRWPDRFGLCLRAAVLSVCSLLLIIISPVCRLITDPAGSVGPRGTGCDSHLKLVLQLRGGTPVGVGCA